MNHLLRISLYLLLLSLLSACGSTPKEVDRDGLRQRELMKKRHKWKYKPQRDPLC